MSFKNIKFGICEWSLPTPLRGPTCCKVAKDFGLDGIELELGTLNEHFPLGDDYILELYKEAREQYGVEFTGIGVNLTDYVPMTTPKGDPQKEIVEYAAKRGIDCAAYLNLPLIHIPGFDVSLMKTDQDMKYTVETFKELCDYAADKGIRVCTENNLDTKRQLQMIEMVDRDNFGVYFDTENYSIAGHYTPDLVEPIFKYIPEFHVKDGYDSYSTHLIGQGGAHVFKTLEKFAELGYSGYIVLENYYSNPPLCERKDDPMKLLKEDISILKDFVAAH